MAKKKEFNKKDYVPVSKTLTNEDIHPIWNMAFPSLNDTTDKTSLSDELSLGLQSTMFTGLNVFMPNPDPILKQLGWNKDIEAYQELLADGQLYGVIENNRKVGTTSLLREILSPKGDQKEIDFLTDWFNKLEYESTYQTLLNQSLDTVQFGRMTFGTKWDVVDGMWLPVKIVQMPHHLTKYNYQQEFLISTDGMNFLPPDHPAKYITLRHKPTLANPYGEPLLAKCYWNIRFKKDGQKLWARFAEISGIPVVKAAYNPAAIAKAFQIEPIKAADLLFEKLSKMKRGGVIIFPKDSAEIDVMPLGNTLNAEVFEKMVRMCDEQNTKVQMGHSGASESTSGDKLSKDTTATEVRHHIIESDKKYPISLFNQLIYWIHVFNFKGDSVPTFNLYKEEDIDGKLALRDAAIQPALINSGLRLSRKYWTVNYGFREEDLEEYIIPEQPAAAPTPPATPKQSTANHLTGEINDEIRTIVKNFIINQAGDVSNYPDQQLIDKISELNAGDSSGFDEMLNPVLSFIDNQDDFEGALKGLAGLFPKMDTKALQNRMKSILFMADVVGRVSVKQEIKK